MRPDSLPEKNWRVANDFPGWQGVKLPWVVQQVLHNRLGNDAEAAQLFLDNTYECSRDPFLLAGVPEAVERIKQAIDGGEKIAVYGDFDADGVTSTVLLISALRGLGLPRERAIPYIPDRVDEGYGLNLQALENLSARGISLVITVDCGIRSVEIVANSPINVIITDHHDLSDELPPAVAVINPKRPDSQYPEKMLAGVGIAYKLAEALYQAMPDKVSINVESLLDLVAIGTVADLAPLQGENRQLVIEGLEQMNRSPRPGVDALCEAAGATPGNISSESIGFGLGPRINAAGRLAHAYTAAKLLAAPTLETAQPLAAELNALNKKRQTLTAQFGEMAMVSLPSDPVVSVVADSEFLPGVVGLVASRIADHTYRPAIVLEQGEEVSHGSCRSIPEVHITDALNEVSDLLVKYGGHAQAAGLTIVNENIPALRDRLTEIIGQEIAGMELNPTIEIDAAIGLGDVSWDLQTALQQLEPTGQDNPVPVFVTRGVEVLDHRVVGSDKSHLQLTLRHDGTTRKGIAFKQAAWAANGNMPQCVDVVYTIGVNEWNGHRTLQLMVQDIQKNATGQPQQESLWG